MNHLLELALHTAKKGGDWDGDFFVVPATNEAERFGLAPGRYFMYNGLKPDGTPPLAFTRPGHIAGGDLLLH